MTGRSHFLMVTAATKHCAMSKLLPPYIHMIPGVTLSLASNSLMSSVCFAREKDFSWRP